MENYPPYQITNKMLNEVAGIMKKIGEVNLEETLNRFPELRRKTRIRSIHSSLAIENNQLSLFQVEDIINGKLVIGDPKDIQEVKNAYQAYDELDTLNPFSIEELQRIHSQMMFLSIENNGQFRNHEEAVYDGDNIIFVAPPAKRVTDLMESLFTWLNQAKKTMHPLLYSSIFHYEFVFIHPFTDGNGRMARLWQTAILADWEPAFRFMPIESLIKKYQNKYYEAIHNSNQEGNSNQLIEFMLEMMNQTIDEMIKTKEIQRTSSLLLSENELKIVECVKKNVWIGVKQIIEETKIPDRTVRRILKTLKEKNILETDGSDEKSPNKKWKIKELAE